MRDIETIDSELRLVAALRPCGSGAGWAAAVDRRGDVLCDERRELTEWITTLHRSTETTWTARAYESALLAAHSCRTVEQAASLGGNGAVR
jgi:hypothetical protein